MVLLLPGGHLIQEFAEIPQTLESAGVLPAKCSEEGVGSCLMLYSPFPSWVWNPGPRCNSQTPSWTLKLPFGVTGLRVTGKGLQLKQTFHCPTGCWEAGCLDREDGGLYGVQGASCTFPGLLRGRSVLDKGSPRANCPVGVNRGLHQLQQPRPHLPPAESSLQRPLPTPSKGSGPREWGNSLCSEKISLRGSQSKSNFPLKGNRSPGSRCWSAPGRAPAAGWMPLPRMQAQWPARAAGRADALEGSFQELA